MVQRIPWNKGLKHTQATKLRISKAMKGRIPWNKGRVIAESTRNKISQSKKGQTSWNKGRRWPKRIKEKIRKTKLFPGNEFLKLYNNNLSRFSGNFSNFDLYLLRKFPSVRRFQCRKGQMETVLTHIRHCIHHPEHGSFSPQELKSSIRYLKQLG